MDTNLILALAVAGLFLMAAGLAWPAMAALWSRVAPRSRELNLWRLAGRRGLARSEMSGEPELSRAVYRCIGCYEATRCDELLDAGRFDAIERFCPNRPFLDELAARHRQA